MPPWFVTGVAFAHFAMADPWLNLKFLRPKMKDSYHYSCIFAAVPLINSSATLVQSEIMLPRQRSLTNDPAADWPERRLGGCAAPPIADFRQAQAGSDSFASASR